MTSLSVLDLHAQPLPAPEAPAERHLRALPSPRALGRRAPRLVHGVIALAGLAGIVCAQLGLSVVISEGAYRMTALQAESTSLARAEQSVAEELAVLSSPQHVAVAGAELGMLAGQPSQFLTLATTSTAGGPDALHMQAPAVDGSGMHVPNSLLTAQPEVAAAVAHVQAAAVEPYPGMLLPAGEDAPTIEAPTPPAVPAVEPATIAPGTLLPAPGQE
jgi:hypothetical protein